MVETAIAAAIGCCTAEYTNVAARVHNTKIERVSNCQYLIRNHCVKQWCNTKFNAGSVNTDS